METHQMSFSLGDETSQMWSLNKRLEAYLSRVKALEEENELLRAEIHHLRKENKTPSVRMYHEEIMKLRDALDDGHQKVVEAEMARDDMYQEIEYVKDLCLQEKQAQEEAKKEISESKKLLEEEKRAQAWLKQRLVQLEEEMEDILRVHEEEKAAMEEEMASLSRRLDSFKVAPVAFQPVNVEDYSIKLSQIWQGAVEDYKNEVSVMEGNLSQAKESLRKVLEENKQSQLQLQNLERELTSLKARKDMLEEALAKQWLDQQEEEGRLQLEIETLEKEKQDLRAQITQILEDRQQLMHLKMSLSLEVATYRSLLEAESTRIYSPTADYKLSSPFSEPLLEKTPFRKRQAESTKTPVARDYRLISTKRQTVEKREQSAYTPSHHLNVKSTSFSSKQSPVTKEFQKVSSVLQSQSLKYTKASTEKAAKTLSSAERTNERRPPTEDMFKKSKVEAISHAYSQGSSKTIQDNTVRSEQNHQPLDKTVYSKNDAGLTKTETVENGFLLPGEEKILDAHLEIDYLDSSLETVKDHLMVHNIALEGQQVSLKEDIDVQDLQSNDATLEEKHKPNVQQAEFDLPGQVIENVEGDLVVGKEEVVTEVMTRQTVLFEKREVVQSLAYQNIETLMKEDVEDHRMLQAISEPYTSDEKAEVLVVTPTHEQDSSSTLISTEREEPKTLSSDVGSEYEPLAQQEQEFNGQVSFNLEHAAGDVKEETEQWVDQKDSLIVNQDFEITDTEQDIVDQQIISTLKESNKLISNDVKEEGHYFEEELKVSVVDNSAQARDTELSNETNGKEELANLPQGNKQISEDSKNSQEVNQEEQKSLELHSLEQESEIYAERKTQIICLTEQITEQFIVDNEELIDQLDAAQLQNLYLSKTGLNVIQKELEFNDKEQETRDILGADDVQLTKLESEEATSLLNDASQDNVQLLENDQAVPLEEQNLSEPRDDEEDQSNPRQELNIPSEDNQNLLDDHNTEDNVQLLDDVHDGDQSVDKSQEQSCDFKHNRKIMPETEPWDSLQSFQEEQKDINLDQTEQDNKLGLDQDTSLLESKEAILSADDVIEEPRSEEQASLSFDSVENYVNAIVEKEALSLFCALEPDSGKTFARKEDSMSDDLQSPQPQVEGEDVPSETDATTSLQNEDVEQLIINTVQENQSKESQDIFIETSKTEVDIQFNKSEQASQEFLDSLACELLREEVLLESSRSVDEVQEPEPSYERSSDVERKVTFQNEGEEITQWTENIIIKESCDVLSTAVEGTFFEEHEDEAQLAHKVCDPTEQEGSTNLELERQVPENETEESISESENVECGDLTDVSQESKDPTANQELELDQESICDTHPKPTFQKEAEDTQEGTSHDDYEDASTENDEEKKDCRDRDAKQDLGGDKQDVTVEKSSQGDSETTGQKTLVENETDSKDSRDPEADQELEHKYLEEYSNQDSKEEISHDDLETAQDTMEEYEDSKDSVNPADELKAKLDQEDVSDSKIFYEQEIVETYANEDTEENKSRISSESISETLEKDTSKENEEDSKDSKKSEVNQEPELEKYISGSENTESAAEIVVEPVSQEFQDSAPDQKTELDQQQLSDIQEDVALQQEDADEYSIKGSEEQTSQANLDTITEITKQGTIMEEDEQDSKISGDSEDNQGQEIFSSKKAFATKTQFTLRQEHEEVCFSEYAWEELSQETDGASSKTSEQDTIENQEDRKDSCDSEADHGQEHVEEVLTNTEPDFTCQQIEETHSSNFEEELLQRMDENISKTAEWDTTVEDQEDIKDSMKLEAVQETKVEHEDISEDKITYQQESALDSNKGTDEEISEESCEVVSAMVENLFSGKNEEVEEFGQTESAVASAEPESHTPEVKTENTESDVELANQEPQDPEPDKKTKLDQVQISDIQQEIALQQEDADDLKEQKSQDNLEMVTNMTEQDTTVKDEKDIKDSKNSEANQGQDLVEEVIEEEISQVTDGTISKTAAQDTTVENQEDITDSWNFQTEDGQELVEEDLPNTEPQITSHQIEATYSSIFQEDVVLQETAVQDTFKENEEGQQTAENLFGVVEVDKERQLPDIGKADEIIKSDNEETPQLNDYESVSKELKDPELDQDPEVDTNSQRHEEDKLNFQVEGEHETDGQSIDVKDLNQDSHTAISLVEAYSTLEEKQTEEMEQSDSEPEPPGFPLISSELENECSESKSEESVGASDVTQNNVQMNDPEATIQEIEQSPDQCSEVIATSQQEIEDGHLKNVGEVKEVSEEIYEVPSMTEDCNKSGENEEVTSSQKEPEDDQKIPFSLTMIQNNLRFISDSVVQPEKQECGLSVDGGSLVADERTSESADLQGDDVNHDSLNKEELMSEGKDFTDSEVENENAKEEEENIVREAPYQDSTSAQEPNNQGKYLEPETNEQAEKQPKTSETESETILEEQNIEQKLYTENPAVTLDFEGPTEEQSEIEDVQTHSNPDDEISKSDESLDSQDISLFSQKSEDFEISKDYQLEQTLPDSTPLPILDDEFEDLVEDKVAIASEEAQKVSGSHFLSELKEEVLEENLESHIAEELKAEEPKQDLGENTFSTLDNKQLEDSEVIRAENDTESEESFNSQGDISISSQTSDNLDTCAEYQLGMAQLTTTPLSNLTDGPEILAEEQVALEPEPPQNDDVKEFQKVEQSFLAAEESRKETESVSETTELSSMTERPESELVTRNSDIIEEESSYTHAEQNVLFSGEDSDSLEKEDIKEDQSELITKELAQGLSTKFVIDTNETEDVIIVGDHNRDVTQIQGNESNEGLKTDLLGTTNDASQVQDLETLEYTREDIEGVVKTMETSVILESDNSISSEEISPNVTAIAHDTEPEDNSSKIEETSPYINVSSDEFAKVELKEVEETGEEEELLTSQPSQEASLPEPTELHTSDEEKDTTGETSDSSFDSNSGNERESAEEQHSSPIENNIYVNPVNGLHGNTIVQATLDLENLLVNGHSTGEQGKIVISERKTIVKVEEDIINIHTQDIIEESVLKFATSEGKSEGLFQSLLEKSELKEGILLDDSSEIKNTIHTAVEYVDSATDESDYTKKTFKPYFSDSDYNNQTEIQPSTVAEGLFVDTNQQTSKTHQEKEDSWSSNE